MRESKPVAAIAAEFTPEPIVSAVPLGRGLINDSFLVSTAGAAFVLQRLNPRVFPEPSGVMANLRILLDHVHASAPPETDWRFPEIIPTRQGGDFVFDDSGGLWRALTFIAGTHHLSPPLGTEEARELGRALGYFHSITATLDPRRLIDTLPDFHLAPVYLDAFDAARNQRPQICAAPDLAEAIAFVEARRELVLPLEAAKNSGRLSPAVIHGDPKLDNVLISDATGHAVSLIDLDTVKPGLRLYDLGDMLRSCCNRAREDEDPTAVHFDLDLCRAALEGYTSEARPVLTAGDLEHGYDAIHLLPFELGLRFLTDHLLDNRYFRVSAPNQNLRRAEVQFRLTHSIERQELPIRDILAQLR